MTADGDDPPTCAICLRPIETMTLITVMIEILRAGREIEEGEPERPIVVVHEDCLRPLLHPDYEL